MKRYYFFLILLCAIFLVSCDSLSPIQLEGTDDLNIKDVRIDDISELEATYVVENNADEVVTYSFSSGCQYGFKIERNGKTLFDIRDQLVCTTVLTSFTLQPGESKSFPISFEYLASDVYEKTGPLIRGKYKLVAFLLDDQGAEASQEFALE